MNSAAVECTYCLTPQFVGYDEAGRLEGFVYHEAPCGVGCFGSIRRQRGLTESRAYAKLRAVHPHSCECALGSSPPVASPASTAEALQWRATFLAPSELARRAELEAASKERR